MDEGELASVLESSDTIDRYLNMIPSRYYLSEDDIARKRAQTTPAASSGVKKKKKKTPSDPKGTLSRNQLRAKLLAKIEEMKKSREADPDTEGKKGRRRGEKRVLNEDVSFAKVVQEAKTSALPYEDGKAGSKRRELEKNIRTLERQKGKVEKITDVTERTEAQQSLRMEKALARAQGGKIRDNVSKLKKTLRTKDKKKEKGKQAWKERVNEEKSKNNVKQAKRKENIDKYRTKKGKRQNGFEGQQGFLNKDKET
eukprot:GEMP01032525.1.p1 GENE.GEMP01032525.1~~GEMP01032525.1.p1  ORF type:complete len:255 (+),score=70.86 GEMP01032525.1:93-857(+)